MRWPIPSVAPVNSPITAPTTAIELAILREANRYGAELGMRILVSICQREAERDFIRSMASESTALKPLTALTRTGKKATRADITIFDNMPLPNQSTSTGAMAIRGVDLSATAYG